MNRDALLATIIGFIIGIGITSAILFGPALLKNVPDLHIPSISLPQLAHSTNTSITQTKKGSTKEPITMLTITSPQDQTIVSDTTVKIQGKAPAGSTVVIGGPQDETVTTAETDGSFNGSVTVDEGTSRVDVAAFHDGQSETASITVYYTQDKL